MSNGITEIKDAKMRFENAKARGGRVEKSRQEYINTILNNIDELLAIQTKLDAMEAEYADLLNENAKLHKAVMAAATPEKEADAPKRKAKE